MGKSKPTSEVVQFALGERCLLGKGCRSRHMISLAQNK
jgi:hypothetical protein